MRPSVRRQHHGRVRPRHRDRLRAQGLQERMCHPSIGRKLNRNSSSRIALARAQATALFRHGRIKTTITKAKNLQPFVEKLITTARCGDAVQEAFIELVNEPALLGLAPPVVSMRIAALDAGARAAYRGRS